MCQGYFAQHVCPTCRAVMQTDRLVREGNKCQGYNHSTGICSKGVVYPPQAQLITSGVQCQRCINKELATQEALNRQDARAQMIEVQRINSENQAQWARRDQERRVAEQKRREAEDNERYFFGPPSF